jgi:hypothetical protein
MVRAILQERKMNFKLKKAFSALVVIFIFQNSIAKANSIKEYCEGIVGDSYSLLNTCIDNEEESRAKILNSNTDPKIFKHCKGIVGDSWSLMNTCVKNELKAKGELAGRKYQDEGKRTSQEGNPDIRKPKDHSIGWQVSISADPMTDEENRIAVMVNAEGYTFSLTQITEGTIFGIFSLPKGSSDRLAQDKLPMYRIDKYEAQDLEKLRKIQKLVKNIMFYRWSPTSIAFRAYASDKTLLEKSLDDTSTIGRLLIGEKMRFRYYLRSGGSKDTVFNLDGADKAITKAYDNYPRIKKWGERFNNKSDALDLNNKRRAILSEIADLEQQYDKLYEDLQNLTDKKEIAEGVKKGDRIRELIDQKQKIADDL